MPTTIPIAGLDDPRVALYRDIRDRDLRGREGRFVAESLKVVERLLASDFRPDSLFLEDANVARLAHALAKLDDSVPVYVAASSVLKAIAGYHVHGGALAIVPRPDRQALSWHRVLQRLDGVESWTIVAANGVTHMDNIGALFRSGAALGVTGIVLDGRCCDPLLRKPIRVAMGHSLALPFGWCDRLGPVIDRLRDEFAAAVVGLEASEHPEVGARAKPLDALPRTARMVLIVGSEGHGLDAEIVAACDAVHEIPMRAGVPSLNVATATAIALYERSRRR